MRWSHEGTSGIDSEKGSGQGLLGGKEWCTDFSARGKRGAILPSHSSRKDRDVRDQEESGYYAGTAFQGGKKRAFGRAQGGTEPQNENRSD